MSLTIGTSHRRDYSVQNEATRLRNQCARTARRLNSRKLLLRACFRIFFAGLSLSKEGMSQLACR